jgi:hypothetical protein
VNGREAIKNYYGSGTDQIFYVKTIKQSSQKELQPNLIFKEINGNNKSYWI